MMYCFVFFSRIFSVQDQFSSSWLWLSLVVLDSGLLITFSSFLYMHHFIISMALSVTNLMTLDSVMDPFVESCDASVDAGLVRTCASITPTDNAKDSVFA